jgi:hypothetical protein
MALPLRYFPEYSGSVAAGVLAKNPAAHGLGITLKTNPHAFQNVCHGETNPAVPGARKNFSHHRFREKLFDFFSVKRR